MIKWKQNLKFRKICASNAHLSSIAAHSFPSQHGGSVDVSWQQFITVFSTVSPS